MKIQFVSLLIFALFQVQPAATAKQNKNTVYRPDFAAGSLCHARWGGYASTAMPSNLPPTKLILGVLEGAPLYSVSCTQLGISPDSPCPNARDEELSASAPSFLNCQRRPDVSSLLTATCWPFVFGANYHENVNMSYYLVVCIDFHRD